VDGQRRDLHTDELVFAPGPESGPSYCTHDTEFVMTFINRHLANILAIAFGLTAAAAGAVMLVYR
jgi:hypothetical protein